jgi:hypothetical protein
VGGCEKQPGRCSSPPSEEHQPNRAKPAAKHGGFVLLSTGYIFSRFSPLLQKLDFFSRPL